MSQYLTAFGDQIKTWLRNDCIRPHRPEIASTRDLGSVHVHKTTIEPEKPRICLKYKLYLIKTFFNFTYKVVDP